MLVNKQLPSLNNGVSQQPATMRLPTQAELSINHYPTVVDGLRRRPPATHVARITTADLSSAFLHTINRDTTERFVVVVTNGDLRVFNLAGVEQSVSFPNGKAYLNTGVLPASTQFACVTVADYTFVLNKGVVVTMDALDADTVAQPAGYWWLNRDLLANLSVLGLNGSIAQQAQYPANPGGSVFRGERQSFQQLPTSGAVDGDVYRIKGTDDSNFTTYFVRRNGGVWDETVAPGIRNRITATTMPWALVRRSNGTFEFAPFSWADRRVGDENTNPNPSFVGRRIQDIFFYKNRLGFAVDEGVILSRVGDFGNFYRMTVLQTLEDEVIDISASETKVTSIDFAVPSPAGMMLFSDQTQFRITEADSGLGPTRTGLEVATQYTMKRDVRPFPSGSDVYFAVESGPWASIMEYFVKDGSNSTEAADVTAHVPRYIPAGVNRLSGSGVHDVLFVSTAGAPSRLYVYKYYWTDENTKAQSAWSYWQFDSDVSVLSHDVIDNDLFLLLRRADGTYLERVPLESGSVAPGLSFPLFLDRRVSVTGGWFSGLGYTEFVLPYPVPAEVRSTFRLVRGPAFAGASGAIIAVDPASYTWVNDTTVRVTGNFSAGPCFAGKVYESRHRFSEQFILNRDSVAVVTGRLMLRTWTVYYTGTAYFRTEVAPYGTSPDITEIIPSTFSNFDGKTLTSASLILNTPVFDEGAYQFGVYGDAKVAAVDLVNDTPYGSTFMQAEWEGFYWNRSRTI